MSISKSLATSYMKSIHGQDCDLEPQVDSYEGALEKMIELLKEAHRGFDPTTHATHPYHTLEPDSIAQARHIRDRIEEALKGEFV